MHAGALDARMKPLSLCRFLPLGSPHFPVAEAALPHEELPSGSLCLLLISVLSLSRRSLSIAAMESVHSDTMILSSKDEETGPATGGLGLAAEKEQKDANG